MKRYGMVVGVAAGNELGNGSKNESVITGMKNARLVRNEVDAVQKQLRAIQTPLMFRAPEYQYDDFTWSVLNYLDLTARSSSKRLQAAATGGATVVAGRE